MSRSQRVPSPEEIRLRLAAQEVGRAEGRAAIPDDVRAEANAMNDRVGEIAQTLAKVQEQVANRGRRSPQELREALDLLFQKYGMSPAEELVKIVMERRALPDGGSVFAISAELRAKILGDLMQYCVPKLRSVEVQGTVEHSHNITIVRYGEDGTARREQVRGPVPMGTIKALTAGVEKTIDLEGAQRG